MRRYVSRALVGNNLVLAVCVGHIPEASFFIDPPLQRRCISGACAPHAPAMIAFSPHALYYRDGRYQREGVQGRMEHTFSDVLNN